MRWILCLCFTGLVFAQGTEPKAKAEDYEVSAQAKDFRAGAEFMVHSFSGGGRTYIIENYLVVEVALYPPKGEKVNVNPGAFRLRIDGKKPILQPDPPATAVAAMQHQGSTLGKLLGAAAGMGGVVLGGGQGPNQVPGGPGTRTPPRAPAPDPPGGIPRAEPVDAGELLEATALASGSFPGPVAGFLYFPYRGKPGKIQTLELLYEDALLKLR